MPEFCVILSVLPLANKSCLFNVKMNSARFVLSRGCRIQTKIDLRSIFCFERTVGIDSWRIFSLPLVLNSRGIIQTTAWSEVCKPLGIVFRFLKVSQRWAAFLKIYRLDNLSVMFSDGCRWKLSWSILVVKVPSFPCPSPWIHKQSLSVPLYKTEFNFKVTSASVNLSFS